MVYPVIAIAFPLQIMAGRRGRGLLIIDTENARI